MAEYEIALALGGERRAVVGSGRAAEALLTDAYWSTSDRLIKIAPEPEVVRTFLTPRH